MKLKIIIGLVLLGLAVGGFLLYRSQIIQKQTSSGDIVPQTVVKDAPVNPTKPHPQQVITVTKQGFSPQVLTINSGTQVVWKNESGVEISINSDPHPTHTDYPPLNLGLVPNGKSKSLVFNKTGKYGYHNHFDATQTGTIIVK